MEAEEKVELLNDASRALEKISGTTAQVFNNPHGMLMLRVTIREYSGAMFARVYDENSIYACDYRGVSLNGSDKFIKTITKRFFGNIQCSIEDEDEGEKIPKIVFEVCANPISA